ncbi:MAG: lipoate--protein ligase [Treponema sp.]|nr:lipoate--protein ligase [Treponema sp.]
MIYLQSHSIDPHYNLALEQFVFENLDTTESYIMLWQNSNSIIVGRNQNTGAEINAAYVADHAISVVRRLSGGGAVYHDPGNLNFTFITDFGANGIIDFAEFNDPVREALDSFGVPAELSGRNDMIVEGKKISGSAQYIRGKRILHHGTLLYDSDLDALSKALNVSEDKIKSKGIQSVQSRVTNIRPYMKTDMEMENFRETLKNYLCDYYSIKEYHLTAADETDVNRINEQKYSQWSWNYGASPPHNIRKVRRIPGCGGIEILLDVAKEGVIQNAAFYGDFFGTENAADLAELLKGYHLEYSELKTALQTIDISRYFHALDCGTFLSLLLE